MNSGLCIQILSPYPGQLVAAGSEVLVQVLVTLACGCPPGAGGRFDPRRFRVKGMLGHPNGTVKESVLTSESTAGMFSGRLRAGTAGTWRITVEAYDQESGLVGRASTDFKAS